MRWCLCICTSRSTLTLLVNRAGLEELGRRYNLEYWEAAQLQGLEYLLEHYPGAALRVAGQS